MLFPLYVTYSRDLVFLGCSAVLAGSQLLGRSVALFLFCSGSVALNLALLTGSVWRSHDRHYTQEYSFHFSRMSGGRE